MPTFSLPSPHGLLVGVRLLPADVERAHEHPDLHPDEARRAAELRGARRTGFVAGRLAVARALEGVGAPRSAVGSDARGAPLTPAGFVGSISHKNELGVGLAAVDEGARIGVDVEAIKVLREGVERFVLTDIERARLPTDEAGRTRAVLAAFSIKESIYKAIDPYVQRWVGYHEALVEVPASIGDAWSEASVRLSLANGERITELEAFVCERDGYFFSSARARLEARALG